MIHFDSLNKAGNDFAEISVLFPNYKSLRHTAIGYYWYWYFNLGEV